MIESPRPGAMMRWRVSASTETTVAATPGMVLDRNAPDDMAPSLMPTRAPCSLGVHLSSVDAHGPRLRGPCLRQAWAMALLQESVRSHPWPREPQPPR
jgi:hypothetical protein